MKDKKAFESVQFPETGDEYYYIKIFIRQKSSLVNHPVAVSFILNCEKQKQKQVATNIYS